MREFNKEDLVFFLPEKFKGLSKGYLIDCIFNEEIQKKWNPSIGDIIVGCTGNVFVISGKHKLVDNLGGDVFFFGGSLCARDGGCTMNSTSVYLMNKDGFEFNNIDVQSISKFSDFRYVPYPHEL